MSAGAEPARVPWAVICAGAVLIAITTGARQSLGLFVRPLAATGVGIASVSFALAIGQFAFGAAQPVLGVIADRVGTSRVVVAGGVLVATGLGLAPLLPSSTGLIVTLGLLFSVGCAASSFTILIGAVAKRVPAAHQAFASGFINAGASLGQFVFAPLTQAVMSTSGWMMGLWTLAGAALATTVLARPAAGAAAESTGPAMHLPVGQMLRTAFADRSYRFLNVGFFACGFHIAFLSTHLPGEVAVCGLPASAAGVALGVIGLLNIAGSISIGVLASRYRLKRLLVILYGTRVLAIAAYLAAPKTLLTLYAFSAVIGLTWLATVVPVAGLVGKLFGPRHLSMLFGVTVLSHQAGGFFGAWLGGLAMSMTGSFQWVWWTDMALGTIAALSNLPIREPMPRHAAAPHAG